MDSTTSPCTFQYLPLLSKTHTSTKPWFDSFVVSEGSIEQDAAQVENKHLSPEHSATA